MNHYLVNFIASQSTVELGGFVLRMTDLVSHELPLLGTIDGHNRCFMCPLILSSLISIYRNGLLQYIGVDYEIINNMFTFKIAPNRGDSLYAEIYRKAHTLYGLGEMRKGFERLSR